MEQPQDQKPSEQPRPAEMPPAPKKHFKFVKLEERITPSNGNGHGHHSVDNSSASSGFSNVTSIF
jgi:hypothetical protein